MHTFDDARTQPAVPLAPTHTGMRISASGILGRIANGGYWQGLNYGCAVMLEHLEQMAQRYYSGDVAAVDEFLQLYCLDHHRPCAAGEVPEPGK